MIKKQLGISLLEVLLSLAIMAVIVMTVVNYYYNQNKLDMQITQAATQIQQLASASYEWRAAQPLPDFSGISLSTLQQAGLVSTQDYTQINPWGGNFSVSADAIDGNYVRISASKVPLNACNNLHDHFAGVAHSQASTTDCTAGNYFVSM